MAEASPDRSPPSSVVPMAAVRSDERPSGPGWRFERKLDGFRCIATVHDGVVSMRSRNDRAIEHLVPEIAEELRRSAHVDCVLDGELVAFDAEGATRFSLLQQRLGGLGATPKRHVRVHYCVFDLLWTDGRDLRSLPLVERQEALALVVDLPGDGLLLPVGHLEGDGAELLAAACELGWEGLIAKRASSRYVGRRSPDWRKLTCTASQELVIGGYTPSKGARTGLGAVLVGYQDEQGLRYAGKVGSGFTEAVRRDLGDLLATIEREGSPFVDDVREPGVRWVEPDAVAAVAFEEWTEGGRLRHPRFLGLRPDKDAASVVREPPG